MDNSLTMVYAENNSKELLCIIHQGDIIMWNLHTGLHKNKIYKYDPHYNSSAPSWIENGSTSCASGCASHALLRSPQVVYRWGGWIQWNRTSVRAHNSCTFKCMHWNLRRQKWTGGCKWCILMWNSLINLIYIFCQFPILPEFLHLWTHVLCRQRKQAMTNAGLFAYARDLIVLATAISTFSANARDLIVLATL